jgi:hypothetical protein
MANFLRAALSEPDASIGRPVNPLADRVFHTHSGFHPPPHCNLQDSPCTNAMSDLKVNVMLGRINQYAQLGLRASEKKHPIGGCPHCNLHD